MTGIADEEKFVPHYHCGDCIHWKAGKGGTQLPCKRIDHDKIKFRRSPFAVYDGNQQSGFICSDFSPRNKTWWRWQSFSDFWLEYIKEWVPYGETNILYYFVLHGDESVEYGVPLMDFVNGTMIDNNMLKATEKRYYKQCHDPNGFGYKLVRERVDGVQIEKEV